MEKIPVYSSSGFDENIEFVAFMHATILNSDHKPVTLIVESKSDYFGFVDDLTQKFIKEAEKFNYHEDDFDFIYKRLPCCSCCPPDES